MLHNPLRILLGRTRSDRRAATRNRLRVDAAGRPSYLFLVASARKAREQKLAFRGVAGKTDVFLPRVEPWGGFIERLSARFGDGRVALDGIAARQVMLRLLEAERPMLRAWGRLPATETVADGLVELVCGLRSADDRPGEGSAPAQASLLRFPGESGVGPQAPETIREDCWRLRVAWEDALARSDAWVDRPGLVRTLVRRLRDPPPSLLAHLSPYDALIVDDLQWLPAIERRALTELVGCYRRARPDGLVDLCVEVDGQEEDLADLALGEERGAATWATRELRRSWAPWVEEGSAEVLWLDDAPDRLDLARVLVQDGHLPVDPSDVVGPFRVRRYGSESEELRALARTLKVALRGGLRLEDAVIAVPALDRTIPPLRDTLKAYGIPFEVEKGEDLRMRPPVAAARCLLDLCLDHRRDNLRASLAHPALRVGVDADRTAFEALIDTLPVLRDAVNAIVSAGEYKDHEGWPLRAEWLVREARIAGADESDPRDWIPRIAKTLAHSLPEEHAVARLLPLLPDALALQVFCERLDAVATADDVLTAALRYRELLAWFPLEPSGPLPEDEVLSAQRVANVGAWARFIEVIEETVRILEAVDRVAGGAPTDIRPIERLRDVLDQTLERESYRLPGAGGVAVVGLRDLAGIDASFVWILGLADGEFPRAAGPSFLLPSMDPPLLPRLEPPEEDRALLLSILRNSRATPGSTLVVSAPASQGGRVVGPSPLLVDLLSLRCGDADSTLGTWMEAQQREAEAQLPAFLCEDELLRMPEVAARPDAPLTADTREVVEEEEAAAMRRLGPPGSHDGVLAIDGPDREPSLSRLWHRLGGRGGTVVLSATRLERYAQCPIRFFFEQVLFAEEEESWDPEPDARQKGTILHGALQKLFEERIASRQQGRLTRASLAQIDEEEQRRVAARLMTLLEAETKHAFSDPDGPWVQALLRRLGGGLPGGGPAPGPLRRFLDSESLPFLDLEPEAVEWEVRNFDPAATAAALDGGDGASLGPARILLRGRVDRVDRGSGGIAVWDYKTGTPPKLSEVDAGLYLQPAIYLGAAIAGQRLDEQMLTGYRQLREDSGEQRGRVALTTNWRAELLSSRRVRGRQPAVLMPLSPALLAAWIRRTEWLGQLLAAGVFPPTFAGPDVPRCADCAFRHACRIDHLRQRRVAEGAWGGLWPVPRPIAEELIGAEGGEAE